MDKWLFVLKNMYQLEKFPVFLKKSIFEKLFKLSEMSNLSKEDYISYIRSQMRKWDYQNILNTARSTGLQEGRQEGLQKGLQKGSEEERKRIARNMKEQGIAPDIITITTGLDSTALQQL